MRLGIGLAAGDGTVRLMVGGAVLEDGRALSDYPTLLATDSPTIHMLVMRGLAPSATSALSPQTAQVTAQVARQGRQDRLAGSAVEDPPEGPAQQRQRQQAEQCEADRLLAIALAQAEAEEEAVAAAALQEEYDEERSALASTRFSDDDDEDVGRDANDAVDAVASPPEPAPVQMDDIAELAEEISTAQAQTAWSGATSEPAAAVLPRSTTAPCLTCRHGAVVLHPCLTYRHMYDLSLGTSVLLYRDLL